MRQPMLSALGPWGAAWFLVSSLGSCDAVSFDDSEPCSPSAGCQPNVVLIIIDDLRPELGAYGAHHVASPRLDALAAESVLFENAYAQVPVCGASRASLLTGLRPSRTRFTNFAARVDADAPDAQTLPELFAESGYVTVANGKVHHHADDGLARWSETPWRPGRQVEGHLSYALPENRRQLDEEGRGPPYESADVDDSAYTDGQIVERTIEDLERLAQAGGPFFVAVGLYRPHLPFAAPSRYWELYDSAMIPNPEPASAPTDSPLVALHESLELRTQYSGVPPVGQPIGADLSQKLRHGYLASVSYSDASTGRILDTLDDLGIAEETIVIVVGDNGFSLGEHGLWVKHSNFDDALRVPLILKVPGGPRGKRVSTVVELLDIYPTLAELAGLTPPSSLDGRSLVEVVEAKEAEEGRALSRYHSTISNDPGPWAGESIRTGRFLYTEWREADGALHARMLYDHEADPDETANIVDQVDPATVQALSQELREITGTPAR